MLQFLETRDSNLRRCCWLIVLNRGCYGHLFGTKWLRMYFKFLFAWIRCLRNQCDVIAKCHLQPFRTPDLLICEFLQSIDLICLAKLCFVCCYLDVMLTILIGGLIKSKGAPLNTFFAAKTVWASQIINGGTVAEKLAEGAIKKVGEPVAVVSHFAEVKTVKLIISEFSVDHEAISALSSLKAVVTCKGRTNIF